MHECIYSFLEHMFNFHGRNLPQEQPTIIHKRTQTRMNFVHISMKTNYIKCIQFNTQFKREKTKSIEDARDNPSPIQHTTLVASPICEKIHIPNSPNDLYCQVLIWTPLAWFDFSNKGSCVFILITSLPTNTSNFTICLNINL